MRESVIRRLARASGFFFSRQRRRKFARAVPKSVSVVVCVAVPRRTMDKSGEGGGGGSGDSRDGGPSPSTSSGPSIGCGSAGTSSSSGSASAVVSPMTLNVTTTTGGSFSVVVDGENSVENLKKIISKKLKVSKDRICLLHRERLVSQRRHIRDYTGERERASRVTNTPSHFSGQGVPTFPESRQVGVPKDLDAHLAPLLSSPSNLSLVRSHHFKHFLCLPSFVYVASSLRVCVCVRESDDHAIIVIFCCLITRSGAARQVVARPSSLTEVVVALVFLFRNRRRRRSLLRPRNQNQRLLRCCHFVSCGGFFECALWWWWRRRRHHTTHFSS